MQNFPFAAFSQPFRLMNGEQVKAEQRENTKKENIIKLYANRGRERYEKRNVQLVLLISRNIPTKIKCKKMCKDYYCNNKMKIVEQEKLTGEEKCSQLK